MFINTDGIFTFGNIPLSQNDYETNKRVNDIIKRSREAAKRTTCYYCGKETTSFCNSHSIPQFLLKNIAVNGKVMTLNSLAEIPIIDVEAGIRKAGTFKLICRDCDNTIFSDYEKPDNYSTPPTQRMLAQISMKNNLIAISKKNIEAEMRKIELSDFHNHPIIPILEAKNIIGKMDLLEYERGFRKAKETIEKGKPDSYYMFFYKKLDYVVPVAFQSYVALVADFEDRIINNIFNHSPDYEIKYLHICVFPLINESVIFMFINNGEKRYRSFYKQFNKLSLYDQLAAITYIMFGYSEEVYFSEEIKDIIDNNNLKGLSKITTDILAPDYSTEHLNHIINSLSLQQRNTIPNLLSEEYKIR